MLLLEYFDFLSILNALNFHNMQISTLEVAKQKSEREETQKKKNSTVIFFSFSKTWIIFQILTGEQKKKFFLYFFIILLNPKALYFSLSYGPTWQSKSNFQIWAQWKQWAHGKKWAHLFRIKQPRQWNGPRIISFFSFTFLIKLVTYLKKWL